MKRREYAVKSWFSKTALLPKKRFILPPLLILCCAGLYLFYTHPSASSTIKGKPPEALQSGGLVRGSGGNIAKDPYASPFAPAKATTLQGVAFHSEAYPPSSTCGNCHVSIHKHWKQSLHSDSAIDPWYLKVKELLAFEEGEVAVRQCAACHAPIALMTGEVGLYSKESQSSLEGVSCSFCHTMDSVQGSDGAYVSDPGRIRPYAGGNYLDPEKIGTAAHLVMANPQQHREDMMRPFYKGSEMCQSCHEFSMNGVPLQTTYSEWKASSYAQEGITCQSCHFTSGAGFEKETGRIVDNRPAERTPIYLHKLNGGSFSVAKRDNKKDLQEALELKVTQKPDELLVIIKNIKAGHSIPTGVTDLRELWIRVEVKNKSGEVIYTSGTLDAAGHIQKGSHIFKNEYADEQGRKMTRHDIWRVSKLISDHRIPANGQREVHYPFPAEHDPEHDRISVELLWRDATAEFQAHVVQGATAPAPVIAPNDLSI